MLDTRIAEAENMLKMLATEQKVLELRREQQAAPNMAANMPPICPPQHAHACVHLMCFLLRPPTPRAPPISAR